MTDVYQKRLERCSRLMKEEGLDALLLTKPANSLKNDARVNGYGNTG
jgi:hypothetical protein